MIHQIDKPRFNIPDGMAATWHGRTWYATDDNTILGVVLSARASDHRYTWVVLTSEDGLTIGIGSMRPTEEDAIAALHDAMRWSFSWAGSSAALGNTHKVRLGSLLRPPGLSTAKSPTRRQCFHV